MVDNKNKDEELWNTSYNDLYDDLRPDYSGLSKEFRESEKLNDDPYWEKTEKRKSFRSGQTHEHKDSDWVMSQHREEAVRIKERERRHAQRAKEIKVSTANTAGTTIVEPREKKVPVRVIICVVSLLAAVISVASSLYLMERAWQRTVEQAMIAEYPEEKVGDSFTWGDNNRVFLEEKAYTVTTGVGNPDFPLEQKLIAVYVAVESDRYVEGGRALANVYAGYETQMGEAYTVPQTKRKSYEYLESFGFEDKHYLGTYGIGNGLDDEGFYFFFVPENAERITFYMEQREKGEKYGALEKVYYREMTVLPWNEDQVDRLLERERGRS